MATLDAAAAVLRDLRAAGASDAWIRAVALSAGVRDPRAFSAAHARLIGPPPTRSTRSPRARARMNC